MSLSLLWMQKSVPHSLFCVGLPYPCLSVVGFLRVCVCVLLGGFSSLALPLIFEAESLAELDGFPLFLRQSHLAELDGLTCLHRPHHQGYRHTLARGF